MTHVFKHPNFYKKLKAELKEKLKLQMTPEGSQMTPEGSQMTPETGHRIQGSSSSDKQQASSSSSSSSCDKLSRDNFDK